MPEYGQAISIVHNITMNVVYMDYYCINNDMVCVYFEGKLGIIIMVTLVTSLWQLICTQKWHN